MNHTFVICAYKESEYLEECIKSLEAQNVKSEVIIATSTPCDYISNLAERHEIDIFVNPGEGGITQDWNFGLSQVKTRYATIAHQDDVYDADYTYRMLQIMEVSKKPLIAFSDYYELRNGQKVVDTKMLNIKRKMLAPLKNGRFASSKFIRRRILSLGDPISCPTVTYCLDNLKQPIFKNHFRSCEDWEAWEMLSRLDGEFLYISKAIMGHRIHEESETSKIINDGKRIEENYVMYRKFWPVPLARLINHFYTDSEKSNNLQK